MNISNKTAMDIALAYREVETAEKAAIEMASGDDSAERVRAA